MALATGAPQALRMRIELDPAILRAPIWPDGIAVRGFTRSDAGALHALLAHGYRHGGGSVAPFETWTAQMTGDEEYDPTLFFLAESESGSESGPALAGAALCWTSAFVKDLVVHESWRRRGLGEALLRHAFTTFAGRGADVVELKVRADNANAIRVYERVGMRVVERLAN
jgi:ribosomal protein S18 acetylase RimI-like enzyme